MSLQATSYNQEFLNKLKSLKSQDSVAKEIVDNSDRSPTNLANLAKRLGNVVASGGGVSTFELERILGRNDLLPINFLERGLLAARAVCRVIVSADFGSGTSFGTGFLVSPRLMITNNHVINSVEQARQTSVQFGYEINVNGRIKQGETFALTPEEAFFTAPELDFTLVAVAETSDEGDASLSEFGFLRLDPTLHKIELTEFVTIIQHPDGSPKQIAIRENKVLQIGDQQDHLRNNFLWYASDTAPGSSGSPVLNDNWQVVAVHHKSVVDTRWVNGVEEVQLTSGEWVSRSEAEKLKVEQLDWIANQGVRTSRIIQRIDEMQTAQGSSASNLVQVFLDDAKGIRAFAGTVPRQSVVSNVQDVLALVEEEEESAAELEKSQKKPRKPVTPRPPVRDLDGGIRPVDHYQGRKGYDPDFLGVRIPLPEITSVATRDFGPVVRIEGTDDDVLRYTHFSVVMCETRRLAYLTAVNIDGKKWVGLERAKDEWFFDPRLPVELQVGNSFYGNEPGGNFFDRGHLVRRQDPLWGSESEARLANSDTFHFTNCSPQHFQFNQSAELWQGLENFILTNTDMDNLLATVFTGPLFQKNDQVHRGIKIPQFFWKVVVVIDDNRELFSSAYVVSQEKFVDNIPFEQMPVGEFKNFQVPITTLEDRTGLRFSKEVVRADVYDGPTNGRGLRGFSDIQHPRRKARR
jgi:endonuclease G